MPKKRLLLVAFLRILDSIDFNRAHEIKTVLPCGCTVIVKIKKRLSLVKKA
jgi:hypothetical protein